MCHDIFHAHCPNEGDDDGDDQDFLVDCRGIILAYAGKQLLKPTNLQLLRNHRCAPRDWSAMMLNLFERFRACVLPGVHAEPLSGGAQEWLGRKRSLKKWQQERIAGFVKDVRAHPFPRPRRRAAAAAGAAALTARLRGARGRRRASRGGTRGSLKRQRHRTGKCRKPTCGRRAPRPARLHAARRRG